MRPVAQIWLLRHSSQSGQRLGEATLKLDVRVCAIVFGGYNHLNTGFRSVVLDLVADILEPVAELGCVVMLPSARRAQSDGRAPPPHRRGLQRRPPLWSVP